MRIQANHIVHVFCYPYFHIPAVLFLCYVEFKYLILCQILKPLSSSNLLQAYRKM